MIRLMRMMAVFTVLMLCAQVRAWHQDGHVLSTETALHAAEGKLPAFFVEGAASIGHFVADPDVVRLRELPQLRSFDGPEHYFDLELLGEHKLPGTRYGFLQMCGKHRLDPVRVGMLPYSISEWTQRLTVAFAEHRRWPDNEHVKAKCLYLAGILAHYVQDAGQPLHTTIHFDGRVDGQGKSPSTGIHQRVDAMLHWFGAASPDDIAQVQAQMRAHENVLDMAMAMIREAHGQVDRVYELEAALPQEDRTQPWTRDEQVHQFMRERLIASSRNTADAFITAWELSATLKLPGWLDRAASDRTIEREEAQMPKNPQVQSTPNPTDPLPDTNSPDTDGDKP